MTIASYTPETIARIRSMAPCHDVSRIAEILGWDRTLVVSVARKHQIEISGETRDAVCLDHRNGSASVTDHQSGDSAPACAYADGIGWNPRDHAVSRRGLVTFLSGAQAQLFGALYRAYRVDPERYVNTNSPAFDKLQSALSDVARNLRRRLAPMRIGLHGNKGPGGGYRLKVEDVER